jgi:hypothetical protein
MQLWRTHLCVPRWRSCQRPGVRRSHECERGTLECVRHHYLRDIA